MKRMFRLALSIFLAVIFFSCKKDYSCEECTQNKAPIANAGADQATILPKDSIVLEAYSLMIGTAI